MIWFYTINGEQKGPVSEDELKQLFDSGLIKLTDLVWREGMSDWASYGSVFEGIQETPTRTTQAGQANKTSPIPVASGANGRTPNYELRASARRALSGRWNQAALFIFLFILLIFASGLVPFGCFILFGPFMLGVHEYFLRLFRKEDPQNNLLFAGFSNFALGLVIYLLIFAIGIAVLMVVGIPIGLLVASIAAVGDSQAGALVPVMIIIIGFGTGVIMVSSIVIQVIFSIGYLIALEEPEIGGVEVLQKCPRILKGYKLKLFMMHLVFLGWSILTIPTLYIGMLWVMPYYYTSLVAFYDDLKAPPSV